MQNLRRMKIIVDEDLLNECMRITGIASRRGVVDYALRELLRRERQTGLMKLKGRITWEGNLAEWRASRGR